MKIAHGFTFIELMIAMGIFITLMMIGSFGFIPLKQKVSLTTTIHSLVTDLRQQQLKAMAGETGQGVYFDPDQKNYVLFEGTTYQSENLTNFRIPLGDQVIVSTIDFTGRQIIFESVSGEISNYIPDDKIVLQNSASNEQKTIFFNKYGTIINVQ